MKLFAMYIEEKIKQVFGLDVCVCVRACVRACVCVWHVHFAFCILHFAFIYGYDCFDRRISFVTDESGKRKVSITDYRIIYPRLISSIKWKNDYVSFEKKGRKNVNKK